MNGSDESDVELNSLQADHSEVDHPPQIQAPDPTHHVGYPIPPEPPPPVIDQNSESPVEGSESGGEATEEISESEHEIGITEETSESGHEGHTNEDNYVDRPRRVAKPPSYLDDYVLD